MDMGPDMKYRKDSWTDAGFLMTSYTQILIINILGLDCKSSADHTQAQQIGSYSLLDSTFCPVLGQKATLPRLD